MSESVDESKKLLIDTKKLLQHADQLLEYSYKMLEITNGLVFKSHQNLIESINLLQESHKADRHRGCG